MPETSEKRLIKTIGKEIYIDKVEEWFDSFRGNTIYYTIYTALSEKLSSSSGRYDDDIDFFMASS
jgi:hypothetical protein